MNFPDCARSAAFHRYQFPPSKSAKLELSINPIEAYVKLVQEAEQYGRLEFLDEEFKQAFWQRMNNDLQRPELPAEAIDFRWPAWFNDQALKSLK